jgi:uncharacterized OB-fold protein
MEIYAYRCAKCGELHYPNRTLCRKCKHEVFEPVPLPKTGKLLTFTRVSSLPGDFEVPELVLGIVELSNGLRITGQLEIEKPALGMKVQGEVKVVRKDEYDKYYGMIFHGLSR